MDCSLKFVPPGVLRRTTDTVGTFKSILTSSLLCCILVDPVIVTFTCLYYQKIIVKKKVDKQIIAGIGREDLVLLKFSKEDLTAKLHWENSKEFEYNRQMYDVIETITLDDAVYYWCWRDHKETKLNRRLEELTAQALGRDRKIKGNNERLISFFKSLYFTISYIWNGSASESSDKQCCLFLNLYSSIIMQPPTPPPQSG